MTSFRFQDPLWLLALAPLALAFAFRRRRQVAVLYSSVRIVKELPATLALRVKRLLPWLRGAGLGLAILALARPQYGSEEFRVRAEGIAIEMCIDRSGTMQALDFELDGERVDRLTVVKDVFRDFVRERPDDLIGLIPFGGFAESLCPLTLDHGALLQVLDAVEIPKPVHDSQGRILNRELLEEELMTAIGDAVALAVDRLESVQAKSKIVILLSDGESNAGIVDPEKAAEAAKAFGVKVYTIGVGTTGRVPVRGIDAFGRKVLVPQAVRLDEATLKMLAEKTGGRYFNAQDTEALAGVYGEIDQLEKTASEGRLYVEYGELFQYFMIPALGLILLEILLAFTRFRSLP